MKKEKNHNMAKLIELYINYIFQKATIIVLIISIIFISLILFLISDPSLDLYFYQEAANEIHDNYFKQGLFIISLFNGIINVAMIITITTNSESFDKLFISYTSRRRICIAKILSYLISIIFIISLEVLILYIIPLLFYPKFVIDLEIFKTIGLLSIELMLECSVALLFVTIVSNIFVPMLVMFVFTTIRIISNNYSNILTEINNILPIIEYKDGSIFMESIYYVPIYIILFLIIYNLIYEVKDLY